MSVIATRHASASPASSWTASRHRMRAPAGFSKAAPCGELGTSNPTTELAGGKKPPLDPKLQTGAVHMVLDVNVHSLNEEAVKATSPTLGHTPGMYPPRESTRDTRSNTDLFSPPHKRPALPNPETESKTNLFHGAPTLGVVPTPSLFFFNSMGRQPRCYFLTLWAPTPPLIFTRQGTRPIVTIGSTGHRPQ